jgi:hypothetical protein
MRRLLVVSPSFPPISSADLHRVRTSLPFYREFGWDPVVLAVDPAAHGGLVEADLERTIPRDMPVIRTSALPLAATRCAGVSAIALRAWPHLWRAGADAIRRHDIDLVFFSTTAFPAVTLGRAWRARTGTPYVVDMQDPWKSDYRGAGRPRGLKARLARAMHGVLEPLAMRKAAGIISVSPAYIETLRGRYPGLDAELCATIPFGAPVADLEAAASIPWSNPWFDRADDRLHGVSVGRGGHDVAFAARCLIRAFELAARAGDVRSPAMWFVGTDYASHNPQPTIAPIAQSLSAGWVHEHPARVPYLQSLRLLLDSDFVAILGSDDAQYNPSKVNPYLMTGRPFVAVVHQSSPAVPLLRQAGTGVVATFNGSDDSDGVARDLAARLGWVQDRAGQTLRLPRELEQSIGARELTRRQCAVFDATVARTSPQGIPCVE